MLNSFLLLLISICELIFTDKELRKRGVSGLNTKNILKFVLLCDALNSNGSNKGGGDH